MTKKEFDEIVDEKFKEINNYVYKLNSDEKNKKIYHNSLNHPINKQNNPTSLRYGILYYVDADLSDQVKILHLVPYNVFKVYANNFIKKIESKIDKNDLDENTACCLAITKSLKIDLEDCKSRKMQIRKIID